MVAASARDDPALGCSDLRYRSRQTATRRCSSIGGSGISSASKRSIASVRLRPAEPGEARRISSIPGSLRKNQRAQRMSIDRRSRHVGQEPVGADPAASIVRGDTRWRPPSEDVAEHQVAGSTRRSDCCRAQRPTRLLVEDALAERADADLHVLRVWVSTSTGRRSRRSTSPTRSFPAHTSLAESRTWSSSSRVRGSRARCRRARRSARPAGGARGRRAVRVAQVEVVAVGLDVADRHPPGALVLDSRSVHHAWQSANSSKRIGLVLEYFLRPSGGGIS